MRKPVFGVSDQVQHKPASAATEDGYISLKFRRGSSGERKLWNCPIRVRKTKALISFVVTAKLICVFAFAQAKFGFLITRLISILISINDFKEIGKYYYEKP